MLLNIRPVVSYLKQARAFSYYITTPIFYVNSSPHIGHVHTLLLADCLNLYNRIKSDRKDTIFSTGTDEHGIKIQTAAESNKKDCSEFCDEVSGKFSELFAQYNTSLTNFTRTTDKLHKIAVETVWEKLYERGLIYKSTYSGWYCNSDETFVPESQLSEEVRNGELVKVDQNGNLISWFSEENYMFRFSEFEGKVMDWLSNDQPVVPRKFNHEAISTIKKNPIGDISISRPRKRLQWGIQVPNDPTQTIYVWLDALTNYLTVVGYPCQFDDMKRWPADCQVIGKDIIKFHAIYWPAFLLGLGLPLPRKLLCHSHWLIDSLKMSKSRGNVVDPLVENNILTVEGLRYYLMRASTTHSDNEYSRTHAIRKINAELADTYGNLLSRCCSKAINPKQVITTKLVDPVNPEVDNILTALDTLRDICEENYEDANFYKGIDEIMSVLRQVNKLYEATAPWKLVKRLESSHENFANYTNLQTLTFESLRISSILLQPIIPNMTKALLDRLDVKERSWSDAKVLVEVGDPQDGMRQVIGDKSLVLFQRLKTVEE